MKKNFYIITSSLLSLIPYFYADIVDAQGVQHLTTPTPKVGTLFEFVTEVLNIVIKIGIPVIALALILSGYMFVTAEGDETKLKNAKAAIVWTTVGGAILLCAVVIARLINNTIGQLGG